MNEKQSNQKNEAAHQLRAIPSEKRASASRENGKQGGVRTFHGEWAQFVFARTVPILRISYRIL